jgi:hypothetical protein
MVTGAGMSGLNDYTLIIWRAGLSTTRANTSTSTCAAPARKGPRAGVGGRAEVSTSSIRTIFRPRT